MENTINNNSGVQLNDIATPVEFNKLNPDGQREDLDSAWLRWKCMACGYLYEGVVPLRVCPKCGNNNPDKFDDAE